jgi:16S rRNA (cytidine1402-2'-O)-methyltransferase
MSSARVEGERRGGRLSVCPTPIGNLGDITLRTLDRLREADLIACEDTRRTRVLLDRFEIDGRLLSYHEHNERRRAAELVAAIRAGSSVALVSDAGMPVISDPGFVLVRECLAAGVPVEVLPGPSAVPVALVTSGLPVSRWCFVGFLPRKKGQRERLLVQAAQAQETLIAFESPHRLPATLEMLAALDPQRPVAVCRELTKLHEEVSRGSAIELAQRYRGQSVKGEVVLVVGAGSGAHDGDEAPGDPGIGA